jgi:hypothetical protein
MFGPVYSNRHPTMIKRREGQGKRIIGVTAGLKFKAANCDGLSATIRVMMRLRIRWAQVLVK